MLDEKRVSRKTGWWLVVSIIVLSVLWCASGVRAGAQDNPPPMTPEISATWWVPTPTALIAPSPLPTTRPLIVPCPPWRSCAWLPIGMTP